MSGVINKITVPLFSVVFSSICDTPGSTFAVEVGRYFDCQIRVHTIKARNYIYLLQ